MEGRGQSCNSDRLASKRVVGYDDQVDAGSRVLRMVGDRESYPEEGKREAQLLSLQQQPGILRIP